MNSKQFDNIQMDPKQVDTKHPDNKQVDLKQTDQPRRSRRLASQVPSPTTSTTTKKRKSPGTSRPKEEPRSITPHKIAAWKIWKWWQRRKTQRRLWANDTDLVTMDSFQPQEPLLHVIEESRHVYRFRPLDLATFLRKEGKFINPYTRRELTDVEISRLDRMCRKMDSRHRLLLPVKHKLIQEVAEASQVRQTMELLIGDLQRLTLDWLDQHARQAQQEPAMYGSGHHINRLWTEYVSQVYPQALEAFRTLLLISPQTTVATWIDLLAKLHAYPHLHQTDLPIVNHVHFHITLDIVTGLMRETLDAFTGPFNHSAVSFVILGPALNLIQELQQSR